MKKRQRSTIITLYNHSTHICSNTKHTRRTLAFFQHPTQRARSRARTHTQNRGFGQMHKQHTTRVAFIQHTYAKIQNIHGAPSFLHPNKPHTHTINVTTSINL